jgi:hypothetical protein
MLNLSIECTRFEKNYSSCTCRSNENLCSGSRAAQEKIERQGETQKTIKIDGFLSFTPPLNANGGFFSISLGVWRNLGYWWCLFLILRISLLFEGLFLNRNGSYAIVGSGFEFTHYGFMSIKFVLVGTFFFQG